MTNKFQKISDRIYYLPAMEETDRPVLGYIKGEKYSLMVDAGNSSDHVDLFNNALMEIAMPSPDYVAITHWHWDHTFGMCAVTGKTIAGNLTNEQLKKVSLWEWTDKAMSERLISGEDIEFCDTHLRIEYPNRDKILVKTADLVFNEYLRIDLGGITCELFHIGGPHSDDSVVVYIPEEKVLFLGDADGGDYYHNHGKYNKSKLENLLYFIKTTEFNICVAGHDTAQPKAEVIQYLEEELRNLL